MKPPKKTIKFNFLAYNFVSKRWECDVKNLEKANYSLLSDDYHLAEKMILALLKTIAINEKTNKWLYSDWYNKAYIAICIYSDCVKAEINKRIDLIPQTWLKANLPLNSNNITL